MFLTHNLGDLQGSGPGETCVRRWRSPHIQPLEIWDLPVDGQPLFHLVGARARRSVSADRMAGALREVLIPLADRWGVEKIRVTGGLTGWAPLAEALHGGRLQVGEHEPSWWVGGRRLGGEVVADLGQTALKLGRGRIRLRIQRPAGLGCAAELVAWVRRCLVTLGWTDRMVIGLPCTLTDDLIPGDSSYVGLEGRAEHVHAMLRGVAGRALVLNDAELAAIGVGERALVVTLGYAPGAAVVRRDRPEEGTATFPLEGACESPPP